MLAPLLYCNSADMPLRGRILCLWAMLQLKRCLARHYRHELGACFMHSTLCIPRVPCFACNLQHPFCAACTMHNYATLLTCSVMTTMIPISTTLCQNSTAVTLIWILMLSAQCPQAAQNSAQNLQQCRAVNQAMGRVIRHKQDYGAIIMCDERFQNPGSHRQLSSWLRGLVQVHPNFGAVSGSLTKFFRVRSFS